MILKYSPQGEGVNPIPLSYIKDKDMILIHSVATRDPMNEMLTWFKTYGDKEETIKEKQVR